MNTSSTMLVSLMTFQRSILMVLMFALMVLPGCSKYQRLDAINGRNRKATPFQVLTDPAIQYDYGSSCYYDGQMPMGKLAITTLLYNGDYASIKKVMEGRNGTGMLYAVEALLQLYKEGVITLEDDLRLRIRYFFQLNIPVTACNGCVQDVARANDFFDMKEVKALLEN